MKNKPYLVGITGGSASGKTFVLNALSKSFQESHITIISLDNYYKPKSEQTLDENGKINFDHPQALDLEKFYSDLKMILNGHDVTLKEYTFNNPNAPETFITYNPAPIIIIEGLFVFYLSKVRQLLDLKIFIEAEEHIKLSRRIVRDNIERGYSLESILEQYENNVVPMYKQFVEPLKFYCDLVLHNNKKNDLNGVEIIVNHLKTKIK